MPNLPRLKRLRTLLEAIPENRIDLSNWFVGEEECGTIFCAVGWATQDPEFQREGLTLEFGSPKFRGDYDWDAVSAFFGIAETECQLLFMARRYTERTYFRRDPNAHEPIPADDEEVVFSSDKVLVLHRLDAFIDKLETSA